jgi:hypothetical protein
MAELDIAELTNKDGYTGALVERWPGRWIVKESDADGLDLKEKDLDYVPLVELVSPEDLVKLTDLVASPQKIDDAIKQGLFKLEDLNSAFVEYFQTRYVQVK